MGQSPWLLSWAVLMEEPSSPACFRGDIWVPGPEDPGRAWLKGQGSPRLPARSFSPPLSTRLLADCSEAVTEVQTRKAALRTGSGRCGPVPWVPQVSEGPLPPPRKSWVGGVPGKVATHKLPFCSWAPSSWRKQEMLSQKTNSDGLEA